MPGSRRRRPHRPDHPHVLKDVAASATSSRTWGSSARSGPTTTATPASSGHQGPFADRCPSEPTVTSPGPQIESLMVRKSAAEVELIRESARWCEHAHGLLQEYKRSRLDRGAGGYGAPGTRRRWRCSRRRSGLQRPAVVDRWRVGRVSRSGRPAERLGPCGRPQHPVRGGEVLVTETAAPVWGYNAELERAMIIGTPTDEMRRLFDHTVAAQQAAFDALHRRDLRRRRPGGDRLPRGERPPPLLAPARRPRNGLRNHEAPFLESAISPSSRPAWSSRSSPASTTT